MRHCARLGRTIAEVLTTLRPECWVAQQATRCSLHAAHMHARATISPPPYPAPSPLPRLTCCGRLSRLAQKCAYCCRVSASTRRCARPCLRPGTLHPCPHSRQRETQRLSHRAAACPRAQTERSAVERVRAERRRACAHAGGAGTSMPPWICHGLLARSRKMGCDAEKVHGHGLLSGTPGQRVAGPFAPASRKRCSRRTIECTPRARNLARDAADERDGHEGPTVSLPVASRAPVL